MQQYLTQMKVWQACFPAIRLAKHACVGVAHEDKLALVPTKHPNIAYNISMCYLIAFSGGLDSTVLLHHFHEHYGTAGHLRAVHIHHGLHPQADSWALHCQAVCEALKIPLEIIHVKIPKAPKEGLEAAARHARYQAFLSLMNPEDVLVTAHHQNDQAETFLYHALRGSGPRGLAAMPVRKKFGPGWHWRPFLQKARAELEEAARKNHLSWIEDDSNDNTYFDRNFLRHNIFPALQKRWPSVMNNFSRAAELQAELSDFLESQLEPIWAKLPDAIAALKLDKHFTESNALLPLSLLIDLPNALQHWFLRDWIKKNTNLILSKKQSQQIFSEMIKAKQDKQPKRILGDFVLRKFAHALWLTKNTVTDYPIPLKKLLHDVSTKLNLPLEKLEVRQRKGGERFHPEARKHSQHLKKLLNTWRIPPWIRSQLPLIYYEEKLVAVGSYLLYVSKNSK